MKNFLGSELQLFIGSGSSATVIACATTASVSINADTIDVACKDTGKWGASVPGTVSWSISSDALFTMPVSGDSRYSYSKLLDALIDGTKLFVTWASVKDYDTYNSTSYTGVTEDGHVFDENNVQQSNGDLYGGYVTVSSLELTANNGDIATYSVTLNGVGRITKTTNA